MGGAGYRRRGSALEREVISGAWTWVVWAPVIAVVAVLQVRRRTAWWHTRRSGPGHLWILDSLGGLLPHPDRPRPRTLTQRCQSGADP